MSRVSADDLDIAAEWLEVNEGEDGEAEACHRVAEWLRRQVDARWKEAGTRKAARELGISRKAAGSLVRKAAALDAAKREGKGK